MISLVKCSWRLHALFQQNAVGAARLWLQKQGWKSIFSPATPGLAGGDRDIRFLNINRQVTAMVAQRARARAEGGKGTVKTKSKGYGPRARARAEASRPGPRAKPGAKGAGASRG